MTVPDPSRSEFGNFLRSRRAKLNPKSVGLPDGRRRRAPFLRREEVAELTGIGVDWYFFWNKGEPPNPRLHPFTHLREAFRSVKPYNRNCWRLHLEPIGLPSH